ncbi:MAG: hybrid sensor histidine kinase/response regulator [Lentimicrobium sp.]|uniref:ATP-binding response regulator n=1 Tax=Lentimicrobium sp. TaxID=2034841 RepID=UPI0025D44D56|nr:hybrid sensor histidine kinase/response regulator [Lentimicrobium sp.]MCO5257198.1 hybrid sensor histidine kinase/response regulator [Lentimicrobium sp.]MCO5263548.1 hybrid sensor histidine kinase/response regulator [Lentimicrobium sp.]HOP12845.1 hybrid sensor histidine kinase/response regulator [Lentimicrobium sp.]
MASYKVLVVDDEMGIRMGTRRILQNFKVDYPFMDEHIEYIVLEAPTGEEAIEIIDREMPDIILLDNKLPGIQGIEVLEYVKKKLYDIVVVMITSYASLELAVKATRDGAYDFIPKPFTPQELRSSLENITKQLFLKRMTQKMNKEGRLIRFQFLSVLSHELKAPINAIEGYLKIMHEKQFGDNITSYKDMIDRSLERISGMRSLIMDLLDLTKIESGKPVQHMQSVDITKIAGISLDTMRPYAIQKDVDIYLNTKEPVMMEADPKEIEIIFNNLISNAVKYNKQGGRVDIFIHKDNNKIRLQVADSGIGMTEEEKSTLFQDFVRIKNPKTKHITGSGLGLSILKKIVEMYHGDIDVESIPDQGTTFTITLPADNS